MRNILKFLNWGILKFHFPNFPIALSEII